MITFGYICLSLALAIIGWLATHLERRHSQETALLQTELSKSNEERVFAIQVASIAANRQEDAERKCDAKISQMRRECEDQLIWAFREANNANRKLAMMQRSRGGIVLPERIEWSEN